MIVGEEYSEETVAAKVARMFALFMICLLLGSMINISPKTNSSYHATLRPQFPHDYIEESNLKIVSIGERRDSHAFYYNTGPQGRKVLQLKGKMVTIAVINDDGPKITKQQLSFGGATDSTCALNIDSDSEFDETVCQELNLQNIDHLEDKSNSYCWLSIMKTSCQTQSCHDQQPQSSCVVSILSHVAVSHAEEVLRNLTADIPNPQFYSATEEFCLNTTSWSFPFAFDRFKRRIFVIDTAGDLFCVRIAFFESRISKECTLIRPECERVIWLEFDNASQTLVVFCKPKDNQLYIVVIDTSISEETLTERFSMRFPNFTSGWVLSSRNSKGFLILISDFARHQDCLQRLHLIDGHMDCVPTAPGSRYIKLGLSKAS